MKRGRENANVSGNPSTDLHCIQTQEGLCVQNWAADSRYHTFGKAREIPKWFSYTKKKKEKRKGTQPKQTQEQNSRDSAFNNWTRVKKLKLPGRPKISYKHWGKQQSQHRKATFQGLACYPLSEWRQNREVRMQGNPDIVCGMRRQFYHSGTEPLHQIFASISITPFMKIIQDVSYLLLILLGEETTNNTVRAQPNDELFIFCHGFTKPIFSLGARGINMTYTWMGSLVLPDEDEIEESVL